MRGLPSDRVTVIDGGYRRTFTLELWTVSNDGSVPTPTPTVAGPTPSKRELFDEECLECDAAVILDLYGLSDGLKFYADALRQHPNARGLIIVRPGQTVSMRGATNRICPTFTVGTYPPRTCRSLSALSFWIVIAQSPSALS
jgi:hypothetical protein